MIKYIYSRALAERVQNDVDDLILKLADTLFSMAKWSLLNTWKSEYFMLFICFMNLSYGFSKAYIETGISQKVLGMNKI